MFMNWRTAVSRPRKIMLAYVTASLMLTGCSLFPKEEEVLAPPLVEPSPIKYEVAEVVQGSIVKSVSGNASFTTVKTAELSFPETKGLRLKSFAVQGGDKVKKGQVLAELDAADLERQIESAKYEVDKAKLELREAEQDNHYAVESAKLDVVKAEMHAKVNETKLSQIELEKAKLDLAKLQDPKQREYAVERARLNVRQKEMDLANLQNRFAQTKLIAPFDGVVLFVSNEQVGDEVEAFQKLVTLGDPSKLFVVYTAPDGEALKDVKEGMSVILTGKDDANGEGTVVQTPLNVPSGLPEEMTRLYQRSLLIAPKISPKGLEVGTGVSIKVILDKQDQTLIVPRKAVHEISGRKYVRVLDGTSKKEVDVETGIMTQTEVEIRKGLSAGQLVILE
ncbi:efflux RND transporter periplasmic adaptor subunit [Brevibacillus sp. 179-C9.3 HS]|uniref:efflux RND transporter periplasmic adaptor subunit n=1 Tax=unclassified Brevibacillus TaxID=2684853 RepID=UPI00399F5FDF